MPDAGFDPCCPIRPHARTRCRAARATRLFGSYSGVVAGSAAGRTRRTRPAWTSRTTSGSIHGTDVVAIGGKNRRDPDAAPTTRVRPWSSAGKAGSLGRLPAQLMLGADIGTAHRQHRRVRVGCDENGWHDNDIGPNVPRLRSRYGCHRGFGLKTHSPRRDLVQNEHRGVAALAPTSGRLMVPSPWRATDLASSMRLSAYRGFRPHEVVKPVVARQVHRKCAEWCDGPDCPLGVGRSGDAVDGRSCARVATRRPFGT